VGRQYLKVRHAQPIWGRVTATLDWLSCVVVGGVSCPTPYCTRLGKMADIPLVNTVKQFVPEGRLAWDSVPAEDHDGSTAYNGWVITPTESGCHLLTEEIQRGAVFVELARKSTGVLYQFHQDWGEPLVRTAETEAAEELYEAIRWPEPKAWPSFLPRRRTRPCA
jgi:hypothetical protein